MHPIFPKNINRTAIRIVILITALFFIAGIFEIIDFFIIKVLLFGFTITLFGIVSMVLFKNDIKKNHLEETELQDDLD